MNFPKPISQEAQKVLEQLIAGVDYDHSKKLDNGGEGIMAVCVEQVGTNQFSVAHYYEQNGDLMADPDVVFWRHAGRFYPAYYRQDGLGIEQELITLDGAVPRPAKYMPRQQRSCATFCAAWLKHIKWQQGDLSTPPTGDDEEPEAEPPPASNDIPTAKPAAAATDPEDLSMFEV